MRKGMPRQKKPISVLYKEYAEDDNIYQQKIKVGAWLRGRSVSASDPLLAGLASERVACWGSPLLACSQVCGLRNQKDLDCQPDSAVQQLCPRQVLQCL